MGPEEDNYSLKLKTEPGSSSEFEQTDQVPEWHNSPEGELAVDVVSDEERLVVISTMAGAAVEEVNVNIHNDLLTIRGERKLPLGDDIDHSRLEFHHRECYWGPFSRTIVLPIDIQADMAYAEYKNGILKVFIPKKDTERDVPINIIEE
ncbi:MAG: Hsp20/alpha crystallin family protein [Candidatus Paceibacteria bacterium]